MASKIEEAKIQRVEGSNSLNIRGQRKAILSPFIVVYCCLSETRLLMLRIDAKVVHMQQLLGSVSSAPILLKIWCLM